MTVAAEVVALWSGRKAPESQAMDGKSSTVSVGLAGPTRTFWTRWPRASRSCWA